MKPGINRQPGKKHLSVIYKAPPPASIVVHDFIDKKRSPVASTQNNKQQQTRFNKVIIDAQESERNIISRELHDNVNQLLTCAMLFMESARKDASQRQILMKKASEYQSLAMEEIRRISKSLSTSMVKTIGLKESIDDVIYNMRRHRQITVAFQYNKRVTEKLSDDRQLMLFRIIQEQTTNIIKHANADAVNIILSETDGMVRLVIKDDGRGFSKRKRIKGIGLVNMINRVDACHGKMNIISSPGHGCTLEVQVPVNRHA
jgi:signal transduction histidine kinase